LFTGSRVGFLDLSSGLGPLAQEFGILQQREPPASDQIKLGTQTYYIVPDSTAAVVDRVAPMLSVALEIESMGWTWLASTEEAPDFFERGKKIIKEIRRVGGLGGGRSEKHRYLVLSFVRSALVAQIAARLPGTMDTFTMEQGLAWYPYPQCRRCLDALHVIHPAAVVVYLIVF